MKDGKIQKRLIDSVFHKYIDSYIFKYIKHKVHHPKSRKNSLFPAFCSPKLGLGQKNPLNPDLVSRPVIGQSAGECGQSGAGKFGGKIYQYFSLYYGIYKYEIIILS